MNEQLAAFIVDTAGAYVAAGGVFAAAFLTRGVSRIDAAAANAPLSFRLVILPGVVAFWPLLLVKWILR